MTYESFIKICKDYTKEHHEFLHPNNTKPLYKSFKEYCNAKGLSEDEKESVFEWLDSEINNPNVIDKLDPISNERIVILGTLKDKIHIQTEIKRGNEKQIIAEIKPQIKQILGYEIKEYEGGNHIIFENQDIKEVFYCIKWHYATEPKQNLIKKTCKELGLTYRELGERIGLTEASIKRLATSNEINSQVEKSLQMLLKIHALESELQDFRTIKQLLLK